MSDDPKLMKFPSEVEPITINRRKREVHFGPHPGERVISEDDLPYLERMYLEKFIKLLNSNEVYKVGFDRCAEIEGYGVTMGKVKLIGSAMLDKAHELMHELMEKK